MNEEEKKCQAHQSSTFDRLHLLVLNCQKGNEVRKLTFVNNKIMDQNYVNYLLKKKIFILIIYIRFKIFILK